VTPGRLSIADFCSVLTLPCLWLHEHGEVLMSPPITANCGSIFFRPGVNVVACTEGVCALTSVGRSLTLLPPREFDVVGGVCLCACMPACAGAEAPRSTVANC
jgi:hypothetical protein